MKKIMFTILTVTAITLNAQVVDDFDSGKLEPRTFTSSSEGFYQSGNSVLGEIRKIEYELAENPFATSPQLTVTRGVLASSVGYMTNAKFTLSYGYSKKELNPLNLDLRGKKSLKIELASNSSQSALYLTLFTNNDRGTYSNHIPKSDGKLIYEIPLSKVKKIGKNFSVSKINHIKISFNSRNQNGSNLAINSIWFE